FCDGLSSYELGGFHVLFNAISDPDVFGTVLENIRDTPETVINHPTLCLRNTRDWLSATFSYETDFIVPKTVRVAPRSKRETMLKQEGLSFPLLMRPVGSQTGEGLVKFETVKEFTK
ncbi:unnamed protein product, partial [Discosporangium mesarthrocarpum]